MSELGTKTIIAKQQAKIQAQQRTIEALMDAAERRSSTEMSPADLLSWNISLERIVRQKTKILEEQGEKLKQALEELQSTQSQLLHAQKLEAVGQLAAGIAHEIKSPTQFISSNVEFLNESFADIIQLINSLLEILRSPEQPLEMEVARNLAQTKLEDYDWEYLEKEIPAAILQAQEGISRVTSIVQAMKEFSHPGGKEKSYHDINRLIETAITVARNEWKYYAKVETDLDPNLPPVSCFSNEISQVFLNLLVNAAQAIASKDSNDPEVDCIRISTKSYPDYVEISLEDSGAGIPPHIQSRIFDPFFTTKEVGKGTGQGLAISYDVIEKKHEGAIRFTSEVGKGTVFNIKLPIESKVTVNNEGNIGRGTRN